VFEGVRGYERSINEGKIMLFVIRRNIFPATYNITATVFSATSAGESRHSNLPLHSAFLHTSRRLMPSNVKKRQTLKLERSSSSVHLVCITTCNLPGVR
jgi:hypothetical protein